MEPTVISIKKKELKKIGYRDLKHWLEEKNHVYIGRNMSFYVPGAVASDWKNPYPVKKYGLEKCLKKYEEYIRTRKDLISRLSELSGCILGCWCKPGGCHGDVLVKLWKESRIN